MKKLFTLLVIFGSFIHTYKSNAQDPYDDVIKQIEKNNPSLRVSQQEAEVEKIKTRASFALPNPEVEVSYLWERMAKKETQIEASIKQAFDFPMMYLSRNKISSLQGTKLENRMLYQKNEILLKARQICANLIYENAIAGYTKQRMEQALLIAESNKKQLENGDISILTYNKAVLNLVSTEKEMVQNEIRKGKLINELTILNGGKEIEYLIDSFSTRSLPMDFEQFLSEMIATNPQLKEFDQDVLIAKENVRLTRMAAFPRMSLGYAMEKSVHENFKGISFGLSIPLWEQRNHVKQAKAEALLLTYVIDEVKMHYRVAQKKRFEEAQKLARIVERYKEVGNLQNNIFLLKKALDAGEMSLLEYLVEIQFENQAVVQSFESQLDLELILLELLFATM